MHQSQGVEDLPVVRALPQNLFQQRDSACQVSGSPEVSGTFHLFPQPDLVLDVRQVRRRGSGPGIGKDVTQTRQTGSRLIIQRFGLSGGNCALTITGSQLLKLLRHRLEKAAREGDPDRIVDAIREETVFGGRLTNTHMIHTRPLLGKAFLRRFRAFEHLLKTEPEAQEPGRGWRQVGEPPATEELDRLWREDEAALGIEQRYGAPPACPLTS